MKRQIYPTMKSGAGAHSEAPDTTALLRFHLAVLRKSIRDHRLVQVTIPDRPEISLCIPFDFVPDGLLEIDGIFIFYPITADGRLQERVEIHADRLLRLDWTDHLFDPSEFIGWPTDWHIPRDWPLRRPVRRQSARLAGS